MEAIHQSSAKNLIQSMLNPGELYLTMRDRFLTQSDLIERR